MALCIQASLHRFPQSLSTEFLEVRRVAVTIKTVLGAGSGGSNCCIKDYFRDCIEGHIRYGGHGRFNSDKSSHCRWENY